MQPDRLKDRVAEVLLNRAGCRAASSATSLAKHEISVQRERDDMLVAKFFGGAAVDAVTDGKRPNFRVHFHEE